MSITFNFTQQLLRPPSTRKCQNIINPVDDKGDKKRWKDTYREEHENVNDGKKKQRMQHEQVKQRPRATEEERKMKQRMKDGVKGGRRRGARGVRKRKRGRRETEAGSVSAVWWPQQEEHGGERLRSKSPLCSTGAQEQETRERGEEEREGRKEREKDREGERERKRERENVVI